MTLVRIGSAVWQTGEPRVLPLARSRPQTLAVWSRTAAVLALTGTLAATTLVSTPKAEQAMDDAAVEEALPKDAMRVEAWQPPGPQTAAAAAEGDGDDDVPATGSLFAAKATAVPVRFGSLAEPIAAITRFKPWAAPPPVPAEWHEQEFEAVNAVDGRTLKAGALRIRLVGLDLPLTEQMCRTLDGRFEPCVQRAATQLELLTRHRRVTCHYRAEAPGEAIGRCRVGTSDLGERLVQTGYVWRSAAPADAPAR